MQGRSIALAAALTAAASLTPLTAQAPSTAKPASPAAKSKTWTAPRTADGHPDLQGTWSNGTITPLERPDGASLVLTKAEAERLEKGLADRTKQLDQPSSPDRPAPPKGGDGSTGAAGNVGGYNNFWLDPGERVARIDGLPRSSLRISGSPSSSARRYTSRAASAMGLST